MRTRMEIYKNLEAKVNKEKSIPQNQTTIILLSITEILLDIRDLLSKPSKEE
jgi:hypothetical protein